MRFYTTKQLSWKENSLFYGRRKLPISIVSDAEWSNMWRVSVADEPLSDMVNRTRAKDAASARALAYLQKAEAKRTGGPSVR